MDTILTTRMGGRDKPGHDGEVRNAFVWQKQGGGVPPHFPAQRNCSFCSAKKGRGGPPPALLWWPATPVRAKRGRSASLLAIHGHDPDGAHGWPGQAHDGEVRAPGPAQAVWEAPDRAQMGIVCLMARAFYGHFGAGTRSARKYFYPPDAKQVFTLAVVNGAVNATDNSVPCPPVSSETEICLLRTTLLANFPKYAKPYATTPQRKPLVSRFAAIRLTERSCWDKDNPRRTHQ